MAAPKVDVAAIIRTAESQIGVTEQPHGSNKTPYGRWYPMNGVAWCFIFVSWVLWKAGYPFLKMAWTPSGRDYGTANGCWKDNSVTPKPGWLIFFDFPGDGVNRISHVGIVTGVSWEGRTLIVHTIEGNTNAKGGRTGGQVMRHNRRVAGGIVGYVAVEDIGGPVAPDKPKPVERRWLDVKPGFKDPDLAYFGGFDNQVSEIQLRLNQVLKSDLKVDGVYGPATQWAFVAFKRDKVVPFQEAFTPGKVWSDADVGSLVVGPRAIAMLRFFTS